MRLILAIDLSTKSGIAIFQDNKLIHASTCFNDKTVKDFNQYPGNYVKFTQYTITRLIKYIQFIGYNLHQFDKIIIEETTTSRQNYSQKKLEFLHYELLFTLSNICDKIVYIRSEVWKRITDAKMSKEEKSNNAKIKRLKQKTGKRVIRRDEEGNAVRKVTRHDSYIRRCNDLFGTSFERKDEDAAAACLLGLGFLQGAPTCNGEVTGGLFDKSKNK